METIELLSQTKAVLRKYEAAQTGDLITLHTARDEALALRHRISDQMSSLLESKEFEDRGDLMAQYRSLRNLHEMLAV